jgi:hypothetical protein
MTKSNYLSFWGESFYHQTPPTTTEHRQTPSTPKQNNFVHNYQVWGHTSFLVFSYLAILASCFKMVLAKLELHLPKLIAAKFD